MSSGVRSPAATLKHAGSEGPCAPGTVRENSGGLANGDKTMSMPIDLSITVKRWTTALTRLY